jgi:hypothetical protein
VIALTAAQTGQVHGGSVEGDVALPAFLDRWNASLGGARVAIPVVLKFDGAI